MSLEQLVSINHQPAMMHAAFCGVVKERYGPKSELEKMATMSNYLREILPALTYDELYRSAYKAFNPDSIKITGQTEWLPKDRVISGNYNAVMLAADVMSMVNSKISPPFIVSNSHKMNEVSEFSRNHVGIRIGNMARKTASGIKFNDHSVFNEDIDNYTSIYAWIDFLERSRSCANHTQMNASRSHSIFVPYSTFKDDHAGISNNGMMGVGNFGVKSGIYTVHQLSGLYIIKIQKPPKMVDHHFKGTYVLSTAHYARALHMLRIFANIILSRKTLTSSPSADVMAVLLRIYRASANKDVDMIGEGIKGARQCYFLRLDKGSIMSSNPVADYKSTCSPERLELIEMIEEELSMLNMSTVAKQNICGLYKAGPHPDVSLAPVWNTILGFKNPNSVDPKYIPRFNGTARRTMYLSMRSAGYDIRAISTNDAGEALAAAINATQVTAESIKKYSVIAWDAIQFTRAKNLPSVEELTIKVRDKASQGTPEHNSGSFEDLDKIFANIEDHLNSKKFIDLRSRNDAMSALLGESMINDPSIFRRFERVVEMHTRFEKSFPNTEIENIPSADLADFLKDNPEASYIIGTEPKLGEFHKKFTRMFYMAEAALKGITQRVEREARTISRKQMGVSIVKGHRAMRHDLEKFLSVMSTEDSATRPVFISFDLSEFSKKFPMALVRCYGKIMSELTGDSWLERIDVIFRSSVVVHNTRGYFDWVSGVKGGFEGFLNFTWSSIHAIIMEIALDSTGVGGELLTFSDDGLMYFIPPEKDSLDDTRRKVLRIQEIYSLYGLEFNMKKVTVSTDVWEYLGNFAYKRHLLPSWIKEMTSTGRTLRSQGIVTVADAMDSIIGQSRSLATSGFNLFLSSFIMVFHSVIKIERIHGKMPIDIMHAVLITPRSCNGLRLPCPLELIASSSITAEAEFIADVYLMKRFNPLIADNLVSIINGMLDESEVDKLSMLTATEMRVGRSLVDGSTAVNMILAKIRDRVDKEFPEKPFPDEVLKGIYDLAKRATNISLVVIREVLEATEEWSSFQDAISLTKTASARKLAGSKAIKMAQAHDTKNVRRCLMIWRDGWSSSPESLSIFKFHAKSKKKFLKGLSLAPMRPSIRLLHPDISGTNVSTLRLVARIDNSLDTGVKVDDTLYSEPCMKFPMSFTKVKWSSEVSPTNSVSHARKVVDVVSSIVAISDGYHTFLMELCKIIGIAMSTAIPRASNLLRNSSTKASGMDVMIQPARYTWAHTRTTVEGDRARTYYSAIRGDRTTYQELMTAWASSIHDSYIHSLEALTRKGGACLYTINIPDALYNDMFVPPDFEFGAMDLFDYDVFGRSNKIKKKVVTWTNKDMIEEMEQAIHEHVTETQSMNAIDTFSANNKETQAIVSAAAQSKLTAWFRSIGNSSNVGQIPERSLEHSVIDRSKSFSISAVLGTYLSMKPLEKAEIGRVMGAWYRGSINDKELQDVPSYSNLVSKVKIAYTVVFSMVDPYLLPALNQAESMTPSYICRTITDYLDKNSFLGYIGTPIMLETSKGSHENDMHGAAMDLFKRAFANTIDMAYEKMRLHRWEVNEHVRKSFYGIDPDDFIDFCVIAKSIIRKSTHRSQASPYNATTMRILLYKFYLEASTQRNIHLDMNHREIMLTFLRISPEQMLELDDDEDGTPEGNIFAKGSDHLSIIDAPLPRFFKARMDVVVGKLRGMSYAEARKYISHRLQKRYSINMTTLFRDKVIAPYTQQIVRFDADMITLFSEEADEHEFAIDLKKEGSLPIMNYGEEPTAIDIDSLQLVITNSLSTKLSSLILHLSNQHAMRYGSDFVANVAVSNPGLRKLLLGFGTTSSGSTLSEMGSKYEPNTTWIHFAKYRTLDHAIHDYCTIKSSTNSMASIFTANRMYYIISICTPFEHVKQVASISHLRNANVIEVMTARMNITAVALLHSQSTARNFFKPISTVELSRIACMSVNRRRETTSNPLLAAALTLRTDSSGVQEHTAKWIVVLFIAYLKGYDNLESALLVHNSLKQLWAIGEKNRVTSLYNAVYARLNALLDPEYLAIALDINMNQVGNIMVENPNGISTTPGLAKKSWLNVNPSLWGYTSNTFEEMQSFTVLHNVSVFEDERTIGAIFDLDEKHFTGGPLSNDDF